jgi:HSP20 family protein
MALLVRHPFYQGLPDLEDFFGNPWQEQGQGVRSLVADIYETDEAVVVEAATPGYRPEDITIQAIGNLLTISGERTAEEGKREYHQRELRFGRFIQSLTVPSDVQSDLASAQFSNGILTVTLPKAE